MEGLVPEYKYSSLKMTYSHLFSQFIGQTGYIAISNYRVGRPKILTLEYLEMALMTTVLNLSFNPPTYPPTQGLFNSFYVRH